MGSIVSRECGTDYTISATVGIPALASRRYQFHAHSPRRVFNPFPDYPS